VCARRTGLFGQHEAGADPDGAGAEHEGRRQGLAVEDAAGGDDLDGLPRHRARLSLDELDYGGDEDGGGHVARVAAALAALGADDVDAELEALLDMLRVADHVHVQDAVRVQLVDDRLGGHADGGHEQLGAGLDDDVNQLAQLALGVVVAGDVSFDWDRGATSYLVRRALPPTCGSSRSTPNGALLSFR
jgi:hypothetical protein